MGETYSTLILCSSLRSKFKQIYTEYFYSDQLNIRIRADLFKVLVINSNFIVIVLIFNSYTTCFLSIGVDITIISGFYKSFENGYFIKVLKDARGSSTRLIFILAHCREIMMKVSVKRQRFRWIDLKCLHCTKDRMVT